MIIPMTRGLAESLRPEQRPLQSDKQLAAAYQTWRRQRGKFLTRLCQKEPTAVRDGWEKDYFKGVDMQGNVFGPHQTHIPLHEFIKVC
jgi:hypothetical protein